MQCRGEGAPVWLFLVVGFSPDGCDCHQLMWGLGLLNCRHSFWKGYAMHLVDLERFDLLCHHNL